MVCATGFSPPIPGGDEVYKKVHKPVAAITNHGSFFLLADSYWSASNWKSQGYAIGASRIPNTSANRIHVRHSGKANTFFLDGHIEAKPAEYFEKLHLDPLQGSYIGGQEWNRYQFTVEKEIPAE